jgi:hypothetical protein
LLLIVRGFRGHRSSITRAGFAEYKTLLWWGKITNTRKIVPVNLMAKLIIEPKKTKEGQIEFIVSYHDPKSDNSFMITTTGDLNEAIERLKSTLESEVQAIMQKKQ